MATPVTYEMRLGALCVACQRGFTGAVIHAFRARSITAATRAGLIPPTGRTGRGPIVCPSCGASCRADWAVVTMDGRSPVGLRIGNGEES